MKEKHVEESSLFVDFVKNSCYCHSDGIAERIQFGTHPWCWLALGRCRFPRVRAGQLLQWRCGQDNHP